jgi:predicted short-subunit dehydrogenase-like oxidoreductase (DUF2520 family)
MELVIIGTGNAAAVLGRKFVMAGHHIAQVVGRNAKSASALAYEWHTVSTNYQGPVTRKADVYILAVTDDAIDDIASGLRLPGRIVAHTAASVPKEILKDISEHYGVFYPLQSLRAGATLLPEAPVFVDASDNFTRTVLEKLAQSIAGENVTYASGDTLLKLQVASVLVSQFTNHLYALAEEYCKKQGIDFKQLEPIILESAANVSNMSPKKAQTGPAIRHDEETIRKHLELLKDMPELQSLYLQLTESIQRLK